MKTGSTIEQPQKQKEALQPRLHLTRAQELAGWCTSRLDTCTWGHGAEVLRLVLFLIAGGLAALGNLVCVWFFSHDTPLPHAFYTVIATEVSVLISFLLNDRFTFHSLLDGRRSWRLRCLRFHGSATVGFVFTLLISDVTYYLVHLSSLNAQALALILATVINFLLHRFWTYRAASPISSM